jgi:hypothetical protein
VGRSLAPIIIANGSTAESASALVEVHVATPIQCSYAQQEQHSNTGEKADLVRVNSLCIQLTVPASLR